MCDTISPCPGELSHACDRATAPKIPAYLGSLTFIKSKDGSSKQRVTCNYRKYGMPYKCNNVSSQEVWVGNESCARKCQINPVFTGT